MKKILMLFCFIFITSFSLSASYDLHAPELCPIVLKKTQQHAPVELVKNGELQFVIVAPLKREENTKSRSSKSIANAVKILCESFEKCTGKRPEVYDENETVPAGKPSLIIFAGDTAAARKNGILCEKLPEQGFAVKSVKEGIILAGRDTSLIEGYNSKILERLGSGCGTKYAAYDFSERFLGVRYYFPGEYGTLWPRVTDLSVRPVYYQDYPRMKRRDGTYYLSDSIRPASNRKFWSKYLGNLTEKDVYFYERWKIGWIPPMGGYHSPHPQPFAKHHPTELKKIFYTAPSGKFYYNPKQHGGNYFNIINLEFADILVDSMKKYYDSDGKINEGGNGFRSSLNLTYASFGNCDTLIPDSDILADPVVRKLNLVTQKDIERNAVMSNINARFSQYLANRMKEKIPGVKLMILAYLNTKKASLDPRWNLPDNVEVTLCLGDIMQRSGNRKVAEECRKIAEEWVQSTNGRPIRKLYVYDNYFNKFVHAVNGECLGDVIRVFGKNFSGEEIYFDHYGDSNGHGDMWFYYPSAYSVYRLMWNPDWDAAKGVDAHFDKFYGVKAGAYLREFHQINRKNFHKIYVPSDQPMPVYPLKDLNRMEELLKLAKAELKPGSVEMKRYELFAAPWEANLRSQKNQHKYELPKYSMYQLYSREKITLDGKDDEKVWKKIPDVPMMDPSGSGKTLQYAPSVKLAWKKDGIYGRIRTAYAPVADPSNDIWKNSNFELFFSPGMKREYMIHVVFDLMDQTHFGAQMFRPIGMPYDNYYKIPGFRLTSKKSSESWVAEFFIPFKAFQCTPAVYDSWTMNIVHNKTTEPREKSSSSMTLKDNFNIDAYGILRFAGKGE